MKAKIGNKAEFFKSEYGGFINSLDWHYYCTFTTGYEMTLKSARRSMERFHKILSKNTGNIRFFWVAEPFDVKEGFHTHALLYFDNTQLNDYSSGKNSNGFSAIKKAWEIAAGGKYNAKGKNGIRGRYVRYKANKGAAHYLGKYLSKSMSDYDLLI